MQLSTRVALVAAWAAFAVGSAHATLVNPNVASGDSFTNAGGTNTGQAIGSTGWYYNSVRNNGIVGVDDTYARSGNGSLHLQTTQGGIASSKADVEFFRTAAANAAGNFSPTSALGQLNDLESLSFDWYRDGSSAAASWLHPVIRLQIISGDGLKGGYLVFEKEYNQLVPGTAMPTDTWVTEDLFSSSYKMWSTGSTLPNNINGTQGAVQLYNARTIQQWISDIGDDYYVTGVSLGVGSGWGTFSGAIDNVGWSFEGQDAQLFNFELARTTELPEPVSLAVAGLGLLALAAARRRRQHH